MDLPLQVGVKIILRNKEGKFLILHRNPKKYEWSKDKDSFDIVGGRIQVGIPLFENLKREVFEETKLVLREEPRLLAAQDILRPEKHVVRLTYTGQIEGEPTLDEENDSYEWLTKDEVKSKKGIDQYTKEVFEKFLK